MWGTEYDGSRRKRDSAQKRPICRTTSRHKRYVVVGGRYGINVNNNLYLDISMGFSGTYK